MKMLLVLSVLQGRHFPKINLSQLIIEARFDGELMTTDPVDHIADPNFNEDLVWEVDRKGLHILKISRTPIKIQCFAVNKKSNAKTAVGYIVMDVRPAQSIFTKPKWYPVLNSAYAVKPDLLLSIGIEEDNVSEQVQFSHETKVKKKADRKPQTPSKNLKGKTTPEKRQPISQENLEYNVMDLKPSLNDDYGYYQIGPSDKCTDLFTFSVTIGFAANLEQLITMSDILPRDHRGFFFYYSLLGNDILTDPFLDLTTAEFAAERASIKLRSSIPALQAFFYHQSGMQVHLCCGELSLGWTEIPLNDIIRGNSMDILMQPVSLENSYELKTSRHSQMNELPESRKPIVGIVVTLKREEAPAQVNRLEPTALNSSPNVSLHHDNLPSQSNKRVCPQTPPQKLNKRIEKPPLDTIDTIDLSNSTSDVEMPAESKSTKDVPKHPQEPAKTTVALNKYSLSIDLKSFKNISLPPQWKCFLRYSYPHFGSMIPIETHPPVEVQHGSVVYLPHGFTVFSFATSPGQIESNFRHSPLIVDLVHQETSQETLIGQASVNLGSLIDQEKVVSVNDTGHAVWKQKCSYSSPITDKANQHVADLWASLVLEDLGMSDVTIPVNPATTSQQETRAASASKPNSGAVEENMAEQVALELEQWKEWQENMFLKQLKEKETRHMEALTSEWTRRETERELLVKNKLAEYQALEDALRPALRNVEKREQDLITKHSELLRMKSDLQAEYDRHVQEVKDASRRLKEDCAHKIDLEKNNNKALQSQCAKLQKDLTELQKKYEIKDAEYQAYKDQRTHPEIKLQSELKLLYIEKAEQERKINALTKSKVHYKQQYGRCLKELARLKQAMQEEAHAHLRKQQNELEQMRLQILATEQQMNFKNPHEEIQELKTDLKLMSKAIDDKAARLKTGVAAAVETSEMPVQVGTDGQSRAILSQIEESCLAHLIDEKETLLKTGVYALDDPLIMDLDKQIKQLVMNSNR